MSFTFYMKKMHLLRQRSKSLY